MIGLCDVRAGEVLELAAKGLVEILPGERIVVRVANGADSVKKENQTESMMNGKHEHEGMKNGVAVAT